MKTYTCTEIASDFNLWGDYFDPHGEMDQETFDALTVTEKVEMIHDIYPRGSQDCHCEDEEA